MLQQFLSEPTPVLYTAVMIPEESLTPCALIRFSVVGHHGHFLSNGPILVGLGRHLSYVLQLSSD